MPSVACRAFLGCQSPWICRVAGASTRKAAWHARCAQAITFLAEVDAARQSQKDSCCTSKSQAAPEQAFETRPGMQLNGARFYAAGSNGYYLGLISNGVQYGFTDAAISSYFQGQVSWKGW